MGKAKDVECPKCKAPAGLPCSEKGSIVAPHVERGRSARWVAMGIN